VDGILFISVKLFLNQKELLPHIFMSKEMFLLSIFFIFVNNDRF